MRTVLGVVLAATVLATGPADAQSTKPKPALKVLTKPEAAPAAPKDPAKVLDEARAALGQVQIFSYEGLAAGEGELSKSTLTHAGKVVADRADAGGWRLYTQGKSTTPGTDVAGAGEYEIAYDGVTARSVRVVDRTLVEKTMEDPTDVGELAGFLGAQGAKPVVAWELLAADPLAPASGQSVTYEGVVSVGGVACDVVRVGGDGAPPPQAATASPAAGAKPKAPVKPAGKPGPTDAKAPETPGPTVTRGVRYYIAQSDHLPRRIDRLGPPEGEAGLNGTRSLVLKDFKINEQAESAPFGIEPPDGYRIKVADKTNRVPGERPGKQLGDPENTRKKGKANVGDAAPAWTLKDPSGANVSLSDLKDKVVVLDFWGTWCPWCVKAMPQLQKVYDKYRARGATVIGMNIENDPKADPVRFMQRNKFTYGLLLNAEGAVKDYGVSGFPTLVVVGKDGTVIAREEGYSPDLEKKLSEILDKALAK